MVVEEGYQLDREGKSEKGGWEEHEKYRRQHSHKDLQSNWEGVVQYKIHVQMRIILTYCMHSLKRVGRYTRYL